MNNRPFTPQFQRELVVLLLQRPGAYEKYAHIWDSSYFDDVNHRKIAEAFFKVRERNKAHPNKISILQELIGDSGYPLPMDKEALLKEVEALYIAPPQDENYSVETVRAWAQSQAVIRAVGSSIDHLHDGEYTKVRGLIDNALAVGEIDPIRLAGDDFFDSKLPLAKEIIPKVIRKGYIGIINGHPKSFKSWLMLHCAVCVATGKNWLQFGSLPEAKTLYVNLELGAAEFQERVDLVCNALGIKRGNLKGKLDFLNVKGRPCGLEKIVEALRALRQNESPWEFIVIDDVYKMLTSGMKFNEGENLENSTSAIGSFFCQLEEVAHEIDAAIWLVHHFKKGNAADTSNIDSGSGSGVFGRAPDAVFSIHPVRDDKEVVKGEYIIKSDHRYYADIEAFGVKMKFPLFERDQTIDVGNLAGKSGRPNKHSKRDLLKVLSEEPVLGKDWHARVHKETNMPHERFRDLRDELLEHNLVEASGPTNERRTTYNITATGKTALLSNPPHSLADLQKRSTNGKK